MQARATTLPDALLICGELHGDDRGFFQETYRRDSLAAIGIGEEFVQHNHSRSARGVLRGLHLQRPPGISKLVRCARGAIFDVIVDLRRGSPAYGRWEGFALEDTGGCALYVPVGFAHGFCVLSEVADVVYLQSGYYDPALETAIAFDDPAIGIAWPSPGEPTVSARDRAAPPLDAVADELGFDYEPAR